MNGIFGIFMFLVKCVCVDLSDHFVDLSHIHVFKNAKRVLGSMLKLCYPVEKQIFLIRRHNFRSEESTLHLKK